jgi:hypothetical protein
MFDHFPTFSPSTTVGEAGSTGVASAQSNGSDGTAGWVAGRRGNGCAWVMRSASFRGSPLRSRRAG